MDENHFAPLPTAIYGLVLLLAAVAYTSVQTMIIAFQGKDSKLAEAVGEDIKGKVSALLYIIAISLAFVSPWIAIGLYIVVSLLWVIPDPRIESRLHR
jgi:uncharacterized membrane protein